MSIRFDNQVAIVTGAGQGLGRAHAMGMAARGAKVVVNDLGPNADKVVEEIRAAGGEAMAQSANVADFAAVQAMVETVLARWGRIDILVNNAGILRDKTFAKMDMADFRAVIDVHLIGSANATKAVWDVMRQQNYGRIVFTSSASGLYGNFGQSNYAAAKAGMVGLMNTLHQEGQKHDIRVNILAPVAATAMTEGLFPAEAMALLAPEEVTPAVLYLAFRDAPSRTMLCAGAGSYARAVILETEGIHLAPGERTPEAIAAAFDRISDMAGARVMDGAFDQTGKFIKKAR